MSAEDKKRSEWDQINRLPTGNSDSRSNDQHSNQLCISSCRDRQLSSLSLQSLACQSLCGRYPAGPVVTAEVQTPEHTRSRTKRKRFVDHARSLYLTMRHQHYTVQSSRCLNSQVSSSLHRKVFCMSVCMFLVEALCLPLPGKDILFTCLILWPPPRSFRTVLGFLLNSTPSHAVTQFDEKNINRTTCLFFSSFFIIISYHYIIIICWCLS